MLPITTAHYLVLAAILFSYFGLQRRAWQQGGTDK